MIKANLLRIKDEIHLACTACGRNSNEVTLVGVTKTASLQDIKEAVSAGLADIAENVVQDAQEKFISLMATHPSLKRHIIGHLQTNKVKEAIKICNLIQSIDSMRLAEEIEKQAQKLQTSVDILVQLNTAQEPQKFGAAPKDAYALVEGISQMSNVRVKGLMCMAPYTEDEGIIRKAFADLRGIRDGVKKRFNGAPNVDMGILSMGMSGDFKIAIEEGSTMVRIGSAIFTNLRGS